METEDTTELHKREVPTEFIARIWNECKGTDELPENWIVLLHTVSPQVCSVEYSSNSYSKTDLYHVKWLPLHEILHSPDAVEAFNLLNSVCSEGIENGAILLQNFK